MSVTKFSTRAAERDAQKILRKQFPLTLQARLD
jgi:hypothetical protein